MLLPLSLRKDHSGDRGVYHNTTHYLRPDDSTLGQRRKYGRGRAGVRSESRWMALHGAHTVCVQSRVLVGRSTVWEYGNNAQEWAW